jgi:HPt (histidine-containing phosphotransfer) domain-containing protein
MNKPFIFNSPEIDADYLNSLYEGETDILSSVFEEYLATLDEMIDKLQTSFASNSPQLFKETIHKYKSSFGYAGFTTISKSLQYIENKCTFVNSLEELHGDFDSLLLPIRNTRDIVTHELAQLSKV